MDDQTAHAKIHAQLATRAKSILESEAGKLRPKLAAHLALETTMSAEEAAKLLNSSAEEKPNASAIWSKAIANANRSRGFQQ